MILEGNQRGGAKDLALHLMKDENDHVELHEIRGFASDDLMGALNEAYAVSRGTKCKQFLYSLSLNPPPKETVSTAEFEEVINRAEATLGLNGQPRTIVFHEKDGRRHAHAVWSRIDIEQMKAVQMSYDHSRLTELSRDIFIEKGWDMPRGFAKASERDPKNFTLAAWQQAKRHHKDPREIKTAIQDAWAISDSKAAFSHALEERGYVLARGDRGRFVAVDLFGEVYAIPRHLHGVNTKQVRQRLGDAQDLPSVEGAKVRIAQDMSRTLKRFKDELAAQDRKRREELQKEKERLVERQRRDRQALRERLAHRAHNEALQRQARFRTGLKGLWDRLNGEHKRIRQINEQEAAKAQQRDRAEKDRMIAAQLAQRQALKRRAAITRQEQVQKQRDLQADLARYKTMQPEDTRRRLEAFKRKRREGQDRAQPRNRGPDREPER